MLLKREDPFTEVTYDISAFLSFDDKCESLHVGRWNGAWRGIGTSSTRRRFLNYYLADLGHAAKAIAYAASYRKLKARRAADKVWGKGAGKWFEVFRKDK